MICLGLYAFKICASIVDNVQSIMLMNDMSFSTFLTVLGWILLFGFIGLVAVFIIIFACNLLPYIWETSESEDKEEDEK
jgi:hypothetical protein